MTCGCVFPVRYMVSGLKSEHVFKMAARVSSTSSEEMTGLEINEKFQSQLCDRIQKLSRNLAKQNMSPQFLCVKETAENGE